MRYDLRSGISQAKRTLGLSVVALSAAVFPAAIALWNGGASAAPNTGYTLFGDASVVSGGNLGQAVSATSSTAGKGYGGVSFTVPSGMTLSELNTLSTDFKATQGGCGGGSPRFSVEVTTSSGPENVFFYLGTSPNYTCTPSAWINSGNLADSSNAVDASQLGGTFYEPYSQVKADYGTDPVTDISLVTDGSWLFGTQTVLFDNTQINSTTYTYDQPQNKVACMNGGWANLTNENNQAFKNQGLCVAWANHNNGVGQDDNHAQNR